MRRIDFEDALLLRHLVAGIAEDAFHVRAHAVLVADEACRRVGQAVRHADLLDLVVEGLVHARQNGTEVLLLLLLVLLLVFGLRQVERALGGRHQRRAVELAQDIDDPLVDGIDQEQDLAAVLLECLDVRAALGGRQAVGGDVIDALLALGHARLVVGKPGEIGSACGAIAQETS